MKLLQIIIITITACSSIAASAGQSGEAQQQYNFISQLKGDWKLSPASQQQGKATSHKLVKPLVGTNRVAMSFKVIGKGSTVQENLLPGNKKEMATMYHCQDVGCDQVKATHYCAKKNQPEMLSALSSSSDSVIFNCDMRSPLCQSKEDHVHKITHTLSNDGNHLTTTYTSWKDGKYLKDSVYNFDRM